METAAINVALGGLTGFGLRVLRGGSLRQGLESGVAGAAGGVLVYGGKRVAVQRWEGAGLVGREIAAVGSSVVWNASAGRGMVDRLVLPAGPVRLYVTLDEGFRVTPKLDLSSALAIAVASLQGGIDWERSASAGAPVFYRREPYAGAEVRGQQAAGVITYRDRLGRSAPSESRVETLAHEQVHVIQRDQSFLFWSEPAEEAVLGSTPVGRALRRHLDVGFDVAAKARVKQVVGYELRPWEREAHLLSAERTGARAPSGSR
ncbi:MAG TPA: hypothetical protein VFY65_05845 [Longimicrobium sp.]|nr:hypothetical protein [Longimicrobium sp.]